MKKICLLSILLFLTSFIYSYDFLLSSIETNTNKVFVYRGKSMQTASNENYLISMLATKTSHGIQFSASITNYSSNDYFFRENCISVYQGVLETNEWESIEYIPASIYFEKEKRSKKTEEILSAIASEINSAQAGYSTVSGTSYSNGYRYSYSARVYSFADAIIAEENSRIALDSLRQSNQQYITYLENNLLFDSLIPASENYNGIFIVDEKKGPDYKVVFEFSPTETFVFLFSRNDKDEILNPWKDKKRDRHCIIGGISPKFNHFSSYYLWSRGKGVGLYTGMAFRIEKNISSFSNVYDIDNVHGYDLNYADPENVGYYNYDWKFDYNKSFYNSWGYYMGMTVKILPYTWLLLGGGLDFKTKSFYQGDLYYKVNSYNRKDYNYKFYKNCWLTESSFDMLFTPQIGINFITNYLDIGTIFSYSIKGKMAFDITFGVAF